MASAAATISPLATATKDDDNFPVDDALTSAIPHPVSPPPSSSTTTTTPSPDSDEVYRHYIPSLGTTIAIRLLPSQGLSFQLWPAATALVFLLNRHRLDPTTSPLSSVFFSPSPRSRLRILELGSGTGFVGISAAAILGADVTLTDLGHVVPNLRFNAAVNAGVVAGEGGGGRVEVEEMGWGDEDQMVRVGMDYDVILGSDVVYHDHLYEPLLKTLRHFLLPPTPPVEENEGREEKVFVMAHLKRWKKESGFFNRAKKWFDVDVLYRESPPPPGKRVGVVVYRFVPKRRRTAGTVRNERPSELERKNILIL